MRRCETARRRARFAHPLHLRERSLSNSAVRVDRYDRLEPLYESEDAAAINPYRTRAEQLAGVRNPYDPDKCALGAVAIEIELAAVKQSSRKSWDSSGSSSSRTLRP